MSQTASDSKPEPSVKVLKVISYAGHLLQSISIAAAAKFVARLFATPLKHKMPKIEYHMDKQSQQTALFAAAIPKTSLYIGTGKAIKRYG